MKVFADLIGTNITEILNEMIILRHQPEQREYAFLGKLRNKLANSIEKSAKESLEKTNKSRLNVKRLANENLDKELTKRAKNLNTEVVSAPWKPRDNSLDSNAGSIVNLNKNNKRESILKDLKNELLDSDLTAGKRKYIEDKITAIENPRNKHIITLGRLDSTDSLSHELGHIQNREGRNLFKKFISKLDDKTRENSGNLYIKNKSKNPIKDLSADIITVQEEKNAWNNAKKTLKELGATKEDLSTIKEIEKDSINTYKNIGKARRRYNLRNIIKTKKYEYRGNKNK